MTPSPGDTVWIIEPESEWWIECEPAMPREMVIKEVQQVGNASPCYLVESDDYCDSRYARGLYFTELSALNAMRELLLSHINQIHSQLNHAQSLADQVERRARELGEGE